jgi:serine/threonine protein phosphatase PrpC
VALGLRTAARSDVGLVRRNNEDSAYVGPRLLAVADGVGGHAAGEVASSTVVAALLPLDEQPPQGAVDDALRARIAAANQRLRLAVEGRPDLLGMSSTLTAVLWDGQRLAIAQVGDSRAYRLRDGELDQLTQDQTFVQTLVDAGRITREEAEHHPQRHVIMQALDGRSDVEPVVLMLEPQLGDRYLLCSDGLSDVVDPADLRDALAHGSVEETVDRLVRLALDGGAPDNITVVLGEFVEEEPDAGAARPAPARLIGAAASETPAGPVGHPEDGDEPDSVLAAHLGAVLTDGEDSEEPDDARPRHAVEEPPEHTREDATRHARLWRLLLAGVVIAAIVVAGTLAYNWTQDQWYVGEDDGVVAIYAGVRTSVPLVTLHHVDERTDIQVEQLPEFYRDQVDSGIRATSREDAEAIVAQLQDAADACVADPTTEGCPA